MLLSLVFIDVHKKLSVYVVSIISLILIIGIETIQPGSDFFLDNLFNKVMIVFVDILDSFIISQKRNNWDVFNQNRVVVFSYIPCLKIVIENVKFYSSVNEKQNRNNCQNQIHIVKSDEVGLPLGSAFVGGSPLINPDSGAYS